MKTEEKHYFRPEWTCGRYDRTHGAANELIIPKR